MPDLDRIKQIVARELQTSAIIGLVGYGIAAYVVGAEGSFAAPVIGTVDVNVGIAGTMALSNFVGAVVEDTLEEVYPNNPYLEPVSMLVKPTVNGLVHYGFMRGVLSQNVNFRVPVLAGAVATAVGQYAGDALLLGEQAF